MSDYYFSSDRKIVSGTLIWYYFICKREVWLMGREITPDEDFPSLEIGRVIHEIFYTHSKKEISIEGAKIDLIEKEGKEVCEIKTSSKYLEAAKFQLAYYLYRLKEFGIHASGKIVIPKERKRINVFLDDQTEKKLMETFSEIKNILNSEKPPPPNRISYCKKCAYKDFCWV
ncbi:MAG: CRISPR-associated protein Cas4 [Thermoprotei archaeon]